LLDQQHLAYLSKGKLILALFADFGLYSAVKTLHLGFVFRNMARALGQNLQSFRHA